MAVTRKDVDIAASLSRLNFTEEEKVEMEDTLNNILGYFDKLSEIDTKDVEPLAHILPVENVMREDVVKKSLDQETALKNAPKHDRGHFVIPKVIE
ncbi:Asp-tRNA(Asn)/Glu-tRNA(Gln) amidotransferase subunit GatC [Candidatus Latescibacterota bacterium]